jgi:hypothetical protein
MTITFTQDELDELALFVDGALENWAEIKSCYPRDKAPRSLEDHISLLCGILNKLEGKDELGLPPKGYINEGAHTRD